MLRTLTDHDMLGCFLPFQVEYGLSAAMLLSLMNGIPPNYVSDTNWSRSVYMIPDQMISKKNLVARLRKTELQELDARLSSSGAQTAATIGQVTT
jgi:proline utilization trans-activator